MGSNIYSASLSGMNAAQFGMTTTQHNIANAATPGYTRQSLMVSSLPAQAAGVGFVGQGVSVAGVVRSYDQFLTGQVRQVQTQASYLSTYLASMTQVDNLVSNTTSGVSSSVQNLFNAMNGLANSPESIPARQTVLGTAQATINSFQTMDQSLSDIANNLTGQISGSVQTVNTYATQIAALNVSIKGAIAASQGQQPNDLQDQRDQLVNLLNKEIKVSVQQQSDGSMSVFVGNGQALVVGDQAMALQVVQNPADPSKVDVAYRNWAGNLVTLQQNSLQGGNLGAYLNFRDTNLEPARNALGRVALGMAANLNLQNQLGQDLNGAPGGALFAAAAPRISIGANNTGTATMTGTISNVSALTTSDYTLKYDGANYTVTRMADNVVTSLGPTLPGSGVDGFSVTLSAGTIQPGDIFLIRPTANAARDLSLLTTDPAKIATALPFKSVGAIKATNAANITTVASGAITSSAVTVAGTTATTAAFTVDGKTLLNSTVAAGAAGPLTTAAGLDAAWPAFAAANPGYTLTGTFALGTAQITKSGGAAIILAETITPGAGATTTPLAAAGAGFMGTTPGSLVSKVAGVTVATPANANLTNPVAITFTSPTTYTVTGAVPAVAGVQTYTAPNISYNGWTMQLSAAPAAGDVFNVAPNSGTAKVSTGAYNLNAVSLNFTSPTAYNVVEMRGNPPAPVMLGTGLIPPAVGGSSTVSYNGWTAQITGTPAAGDVFNVSKSSNAGTMLVAPSVKNTGLGAISGGAFAVAPFAITFNNPPTSYTVSGATPAVAGSIPYVAGQDISYNGWTMQVTGKPGAGDVFNVGANTTASGDNRNALLMAAQQSQNTLANGTTSFEGAFAQLVGSIGAKAQELTITSKAQDAMLVQTTAAQQSVAGVNLDEEAANLLRYQRAYQAAAKAMQIANTMFDSLLSLGR